MVHHCRLTLTAFLHQVGSKVNSSADLADLADPADQANQVSLSAARSLPSTRAGGQDDVSFNKLPQINPKHTFSMKYCLPPGPARPRAKGAEDEDFQLSRPQAHRAQGYFKHSSSLSERSESCVIGSCIHSTKKHNNAQLLLICH